MTPHQEAKDLATLHLDELIENLKVYEMVLDNNGVRSKTTKEKELPQGNKGGESSTQKGACYNCGIEGHFASECKNPKENKAFVRGAWSDSEDGDEHQNGTTCLMAIDSQEGYDGGHLIFGSNLKGKVVGRGNITYDSITITNVEHVSGLAFNFISVGQLWDDDCVVSFTKLNCNICKNGRKLAKGHKRNGLYTCKLGDNSKQQICLASVVDNSTLWHRRLGDANIRESSLPEPKSSSLVEDDRMNEPIVQDLNWLLSLQVNVSDEGYPKSLKESRGLPIEQVIGKMNERTLMSKTKQAWDFHMTFPNVKFA
ncbi:retrotransposon protein [Tanacetum coccineum]